MSKFEIIVKNLKSNQYAAISDRALFESFSKGTITLQNAIYEFKKNNSIRQSLIIDETLFVEWLKSLGY